MRVKIKNIIDIILAVTIGILFIVLFFSLKKDKTESDLFLENFKYTIADDEIYIVSTNSQESQLTIPETVNINGKDYTVTKILDSAFENNETITGISLPKTIKEFGDNAFKNCTNLKTITIPENCESIGKNAFYNCTSVGTINYNSIQNFVQIPLYGEVFNNIGKTTPVKVVIGSDVTNIPSYLFASVKAEDAINIESVEFKGDKCLQIGEGSFINAKLSTLTLPASISVFGPETFKNSSISEIIIEGSPEFLPDYMFYNCKNLQQIFIPESVKIIGVRCFAESGLISINLSENTQYIGMSAFNGSKLQIINYNGSKDMWEKININVDKSEEFMNAKITFVEN